jgi:hypothetical protein
MFMLYGSPEFSFNILQIYSSDLWDDLLSYNFFGIFVFGDNILIEDLFYSVQSLPWIVPS